MIISHSSYNRELLKWQRAGGTVWQDDCWPIDILDECPVNFKAINFNIISAIYSNLVWLYFNEDKLPKMIGNSDWYIRIYPPDICPPRNLVDDHGCLPHWSPHKPLFIQSSLSRSLVKAKGVAAVEWKLFFWYVATVTFEENREILPFINQKGNGKEMKARLQARHPNPKYTPETYMELEDRLFKNRKLSSSILVLERV